MSRLLVKIKYNGHNYVGWQVQNNGLSVQECVQNAVERIYGKRYDITGCSRTDSGVHANGYCFCFEPEGDIDPYRVPLALNFALPEDIAAFECISVSDEFHPRYNAIAKEYIYKLYDGRNRNPFLKGLAYHYPGKLNVELMDEAASHIIGTHDFRCFMANGSKIIDTVRTIYRCNVTRKEDHVEVKICGDGFLYKMVRIIVGTLIFVSEGKFQPSDIPGIIASLDRNKAGKTASPEGLYLNKVYYDPKEVEDCGK